MTKPIGLAEFIHQVKREMLEEKLDAKAPLLAVDEVDLEIAITVSREAKAGLNIQVLELGTGGERSDAHTVRVKLVPLLTREERVAELRKSRQWSQIVEQQVESTLKGLTQESQRDQY